MDRVHQNLKLLLFKILENEKLNQILERICKNLIKGLHPKYLKNSQNSNYKKANNPTTT